MRRGGESMCCSMRPRPERRPSTVDREFRPAVPADLTASGRAISGETDGYMRYSLVKGQRDAGISPLAGGSSQCNGLLCGGRPGRTPRH
jgi:hypothetical protein